MGQKPSIELDRRWRKVSADVFLSGKPKLHSRLVNLRF
jgi:hypothetical protein